MSVYIFGVALLYSVAITQGFTIAGRNASTSINGVEVAGPIIGGRETDIEDYPHQLYMRAGNAGCGAAIIGERWAITAAHCCGPEGSTYRTFLPRQVTLRSGSTYRNNGGTIHKVLEIRHHKNYSPRSSDNDICLLKVTHDNPFVFNSKTRKIELPSATSVVTSSSAYASGWGVTRRGGRGVDHLQSVELPIITNQKCQELYFGFSEAQDITERQLCAYEKGKDTCQGDSGGALIADGKILGVTSWGIGCAVRPGVYTRVSAYRDWIQRITGI